MKHVISGIEDLNLDLYEDVTRNGGTIELSPQLAKQIDEQRQKFLDFVVNNRQLSLYGITTKQGIGAKKVLTDEELDEFGERLPGYGGSFGESFPQEFIRGAVLTRTVDYLAGTNCPRSKTVQRVYDMLKREEMPPVPMKGNGDPGDIIPCGALFADEFNGSLQLGEGMGLINGSPFSTNALCDAYIRVKNLADPIERIFALAAFAAGAPEMHFNHNLGDKWDDEFIAQSLANISHYLEGTWDESNHLFYQAPCSFRSTQRVIGWLRRTIQSTHDFALKTLRQPVNNPMFIGPEKEPPYGRVLSNGGWHSAYAGPVLDALTRSLADTATMLAMTNNRVCEIPGGLLEVEPEQQVSAMCMVACGWVEEARNCATNTLTSMCNSGHTDTGTPDTLAWRKAVDAEEALECVATILACSAASLVARKEMEIGNAKLNAFQKGIISRLPVGTTPQFFRKSVADVRQFIFG
ncbi:phenylalanine and histidine ammonia-lyase [Desulfitobacterium hafniense DP7]|uniref:Phenylalanine and histidine ammonia-lyase n=1 Tax=Desulfitobacterium hafniense DP7 TaxID=537010 RepID=G9XGS2_DESHA|nr:aromatic amino acid lyase [Desulfitobacterium hafniense]EHL09107.1 phenylalanine and histidine ammonia-lyase [Desulfitobacterium hafniense DP7]